MSVHALGLNGGPSEVFQYTLQVFAKNALDNGALQGQYAFQLSGQASNANSGAQAVGGAGSFTADGNGNITAGILDLNTPVGVEAGLPVTGTYRVDAYGRGTASLATSIGTLQLQVQGMPLFSSTLVPINTGLSYANPVPTYLTGGVFSTSAAGLVSVTGTLVQTQPPPSPNFIRSTGNPFLPMLNSTYVASLAGEQGGSNTVLGGALQFAFTNAGTVTSTGTITGHGTSFSYAGLTGSYPQFDAITGRTTFTLTDPMQPSAAAQMYSVYQLPQGTGFYFLSISSRSQVGLLAGTAGTF